MTPAIELPTFTSPPQCLTQTLKIESVSVPELSANLSL